MDSAIAALGPLDQQKTASERVGDRLRELIVTGILVPGEKLPSENELARALQVSRPVVREALRSLAALGIIETRQGGGAFVTDLTVARLMEPLNFYLQLGNYNMDDLFDARGAVERTLGEWAAQRASADHHGRLLHLAEMGYRLAGDPVGFRVMDLEFHSLICEAAGNGFLTGVSLALYNLGLDHRRRASQMPGVLDQSARDHEAIVRGIVDRDAEAAGRAMAAHVEHVRRTTRAAQGA